MPPPRLALLLLALFSTLLLRAQPPADPTTYSLSTTSTRVITLNGPFRFHPGDNPAWASPSFDDSHWTTLPGDQSWPLTGPTRNLAGYAWYRFRVQLPANPGPLAIELPHVLISYQLFADGHFLGSPLPIPLDQQAIRNSRAVYSLPSFPGPHTLTFALRVWNSPHWSASTPGGPEDALRLGTTSLVQRDLILVQQRLLASGFVDYLLQVLRVLAALVAFALFLIRRTAHQPQAAPRPAGSGDERTYLWFALANLSYALWEGVDLISVNRNLPIFPTDLAEQVLTTLSLASSAFFYVNLLGSSRRFLLPIVALPFLYPLLYLLHYALSPALASPVAVFISAVFPLPQIISTLWITSLFLSALRRGVPDAKLLVGPVLFQQLTYCFFNVAQALWVAGFLHRFMDNPELIHSPFPIYLFQLTVTLYLLALLAVLILRSARTTRAHDQLQRDLLAARSLQELLIPTTLPPTPGFLIETAYHPAQQVGGDFFQILPLHAPGASSPPDQAHPTLAILGDVAGKGLPAAMTVSLLVGILRAEARHTHSPALLLHSLNQQLLGRGTGFTTAIVLLLHPSGHITLANAGHLPPYLNGYELPTSPALPLGLDPNALFPEQTLLLHPGDRLTLLTDGIPEATAPTTRELFGFERTARLSTENAPRIATEALSFGQSDDITVLSLVAAGEPPSSRIP